MNCENKHFRRIRRQVVQTFLVKIAPEIFIYYFVKKIADMKKMLCLALVILLAVSCKKKEIDFTLKGTVTDATFGGGLQGATVKLTKVPAASGAYVVVGNATLGADGSYSFTFERDKAEKYILEISKDRYFGIQHTVNFSEFSTEEPLVKNFSTNAKSWVKLRFVNVSPAANSDVLKFNKQEGKTGCPECCTTDAHYLYGIVDTTFTCVNNGNTTYSYYYNVQGTPVQGIESVVTVPFDTVTIFKEY